MAGLVAGIEILVNSALPEDVMVLMVGRKPVAIIKVGSPIERDDITGITLNPADARRLAEAVRRQPEKKA